MKTTWWVIAASSIALAIAGCGGGGSGMEGGNVATRAQIQEQHAMAVRSILQSGIQSPAMAGIRNAAGSVSPGGNGMMPSPMPMIGSFFRFGAGIAFATGFSEPGGGEGGSPDPGEPPVPQTDFYYDEWLGLWVQMQFEETRFRFDFYEDERKQLPAGFAESTWTGNFETYPQVWSSEFQITAGMFARSSGSYVSTLTSPTDGTMQYSYHWNDGASGQGRSEWNATGSTYANETTAADGSWFKDRGNFSNEGGGESSSEDSQGFRTRYVWNADGSGHGLLEGPMRNLPAEIRWDTFGNGTIRYADGTVEEFHWWFIVSPEEVPPDTGEGEGGGGEGGGGSTQPSPGT